MNVVLFHGQCYCTFYAVQHINSRAYKLLAYIICLYQIHTVMTIRICLVTLFIFFKSDKVNPTDYATSFGPGWNSNSQPFDLWTNT